MSTHWMDDYLDMVERHTLKNGEELCRQIERAFDLQMDAGMFKSCTATEIAIAEQSRLFREAQRKIIQRKFVVPEITDLSEYHSAVTCEEGSVTMRGNGELLTFMGIRVAEPGESIDWKPGVLTVDGRLPDNAEMMELPIPDLVIEGMFDYQEPWPRHKAIAWMAQLIRQAQRLGLSVAAVRNYMNREVLFVFLGVEAQSKVLGLLNRLRKAEGLAAIDTRDNSRGA